MHCFALLTLSDNGNGSLATSLQDSPGGEAAGLRFLTGTH